MISVDEAIARIIAARPRPQSACVDLDDAMGLRLSEPLTAGRTQPPADMSAMDGYAVRQADLDNATVRLKLVGEAPAGRPFPGSLNAGETVRIFTGGVVPDGADRVVVQEAATKDGDHVALAIDPEAGRHIRAAGLDYHEGDVLAPAGTVMTPPVLALAASANLARLTVERALKVAVISNGDELRLPGEARAPEEIVNSNPFVLGGLIRQWGGEMINLGIARDTRASIAEKIEAANDADIIVPIGGASVGDHDHMAAAFTDAGFKSIFQKIAVKPGKPTWFSERGDQRVLGLPGNPASALVCALLFLKPLVSRADGLRVVGARLANALPANGPREQFLRARLSINNDAVLMATPASRQDSGLIAPFVTTGGLIRRPANGPAMSKGDIAPVILTPELASFSVTNRSDELT